MQALDDRARRAGGREHELQRSDSWSGTPASAKVGTSGIAEERFALVTASARTRPPRTCSVAFDRFMKAIGVWPCMVDCSAGLAPPNGTPTTSSA